MLLSKAIMSKNGITVVDARCFAHGKEIQEFVESLGFELKYMGQLSMQRIAEARLACIGIYQGEVVGIAAIERTKWMHKCFVVVRQRHQGKSIAKQLIASLMCEASNNHIAAVVAVIEKENTQSKNLFLSCAFRCVGVDGNLQYFINTKVFFGRVFGSMLSMALRLRLFIRLLRQKKLL